MRCQVKVVCRFCGHEFWAGLQTEGPVAPDHLYVVTCPCNGSPFLFRMVKDRPEPWDEARVFQAVEWQPVEHLEMTDSQASTFEYAGGMSDR